MHAFIKRLDVRVSAAYAFVATLWIVFSDMLVGLLFAGNQPVVTVLSQLKGMGFVGITTLAVFAVLSAELRKQTRLERALQHDISERKLAEKELEALYNATSYLFHADSLAELGHQIVEAVVQEFEHADCGLMLVDRKENKIIRLARTGAYNIRPAVSLTPDGLGLVPLAIRTGNTVYAPDVTHDPSYFPSEAKTKSELVIPLKTPKGVIAVLDLQRAEANAFSERDQRILTAYAERAVAAIENMLLYEEINLYAEELEQRVTERTAELQSAKERVEAILNNSLDGILLVHSDLSIRQVNAAFNRLFAYQSKDRFAQSLLDLIDIDDKSRVATIMQTAFTDQFTKTFEARLLRKDSTCFDAEVSIAHIKNDGLVCTIHDITERKEQERQLREAEHRYHALFEQSHDAVFILDLNGKHRETNRRAAELLGYTVREMEHLSFRDLSVEVSESERMQERLLDGEHIPVYERLFRKKDGSLISVEINVELVRDIDGHPLHIQSVVRDITERKQAEAALRESEEKFRLLLESAPIAVVTSNQSGLIALVNKQAELLFGYTRDELVGQSVELLIPDQIRARHTVHQMAYLATPHPRPMGGGPELFAKNKDGREFPVEIELSYVETKDGLLVMSFVLDITQRKKAEAALRQSLAKAKELGELKSRFVSMASHEFRTPLATILAASETLSAYRHKLTDDQIEQRFNKIRDQVGHLKSITEDVLQLARMQARRVEFIPLPIDLDALCRSVLDEFESRPDVTHHLIYHCTSAVRDVKLDRTLMRQIITNLVANAIKYSSPDKPVTITLANTSTAAILTVHDEGIGIPEAELNHLFEPFHRATNVGTISGTGLGLSIVKEAVDLHHGTISVESQVGQQTTFTVTIPLMVEDEAQYE